VEQNQEYLQLEKITKGSIIRFWKKIMKFVVTKDKHHLKRYMYNGDEFVLATEEQLKKLASVINVIGTQDINRRAMIGTALQSQSEWNEKKDPEMGQTFMLLVAMMFNEFPHLKATRAKGRCQRQFTSLRFAHRIRTQHLWDINGRQTAKNLVDGIVRKINATLIDENGEQLDKHHSVWNGLMRSKTRLRDCMLFKYFDYKDNHIELHFGILQ